MRTLIRFLALLLVVMICAFLAVEVAFRTLVAPADLQERLAAQTVPEKAEGTIRVLSAVPDLLPALKKADPDLSWDVVFAPGLGLEDASRLSMRARYSMGFDVVVLDDLSVPERGLAFANGKLVPALTPSPFDGPLGPFATYRSFRLRKEKPAPSKTEEDELTSALALYAKAAMLDVVVVGQSDVFAAKDDVAKAATWIAERVRFRLRYIPADRVFDEVEGDDNLQRLQSAGQKLADWKIEFAGQDFTGAHLLRIAERGKSEPLLRTARETLRRPVHVEDLLYFVDDVLRAGRGVLRGRQIYVTPARVRNTGITVHPDEVFGNKPARHYPHKWSLMAIDEPQEPEGLVAAADGDPIGPNWAMRFPNPKTEAARMDALKARNPKFHARVASLVKQLKEQGADVFIDSTVRAPERGLLMWGAFLLKDAKDEADMKKKISMLQKYNKKWRRNVDIAWWHPGGFEATKQAAQALTDTYGVVYATKRGAEKSEHYDAVAVDMTAVGLPRSLRLRGFRRRTKVFNLSAARQTRDLSLTPELVTWIEKNFGLKKLKSDYPHWSAK